ncbi:LacI family DNA-binding transcriptional regulator [Streptococcus dysgalactiae]|uniref:LacI family DNA-binding transcriptional regulator n=1 Tax=Streptococcus dysgalactiae TaxID=1334 RepID=UPI0012A8632D|nr:LacI family DNA-binding transcriptional regulator [Streptococcus dysgalactiae]QGH04252.1 LacI family transcriptional regulator [Streptococcus dysgalactiae subsp. dysgalactiae]WCE85622.1 LacI family DNA-binding transcriptional regulator [Streptococcus dysgalactiae]WCN25622.1 LacI family DNA-binding transcriptional regulator [Streptococcus dysgalactiae]
MATIKEIAAELGISPMTVSNVLNNKKHKVSEKTYQRVMALVQKRGYIPDANARTLSSGSSRIIALWLPSFEQKSLLEIPYLSTITATISRFANQNHYEIMLLSTPSVQEFCHAVKSWGIDGAVAFGVSSENAQLITQVLTIPTIFIDSYVEDSGICTINSDDFSGAYLATKHLCECGHTAIAFASGKEVYQEDRFRQNGLLYQRFLGYQKAIQEYNLDSHLLGEEISFEGGVLLGKAIAQHNPKQVTAIFSTADEMIVGIKEGLESSGQKVPTDFSLIGFDNLPFTSYTSPKLSTVHQETTQKAQLAIDSLLALMSGKPIQNKQVLPIQLLKRESVLDKRKQS